MDLLTKSLLEDLLETPITVALYGGGFKPPTKGHFNVVEKTLEELPDIDQLILYVGGGEREGITQEESLKVWDIYKNYLSPKVTTEPSVAPIKSILNYAKNNPTHKVYWILGARDGDEGDLADIANRTRSIDKYPNLEVKVITSSGGVSGTKTRQAIKSNNKEQFLYMIPDVEEKEEIWNILKPAVKESKSRAQILKERQQKIQEGFFENMKTKFQKFLAALKQEGQETKEAVGLLIHAAQGKIELTDKDKEYIGNQLKDVLKTIGLVGIAALPGGFIAAALIKLFKAEHLVTPSAFVNEVGEANLTPYKWKEIDREGYYVYTRFVTDSETQYDVDIKSTVYFPPGQMEPQPALEIEFTAKLKDAEGSSAKIVVNKGEMYRVMSTIVDIIKKYIKKSKAQAIIYSPSKKSSEENFGTQRDNLYRAFISKAFPGTTFKQSGDFITAILPSVNEGTCGYDTDVTTGKKLDTPGGLEEGKQVGPLYHYTSADGLEGILSSNRMNASEEYYLGNDLYYISFTRNKNFHKKGSKFGVKTEYRITLDGDKLSNRYKITPFAYRPGWNYEDNWEYDWLEDEPESVVRDFFNNTGDYDEQEERISFKGPEGGIDNIKNYILAVDKVEDLQENIISETMTVYRLGEIPYDEKSFFVTPDYKTWIKFYPGEEIHKITTNKLYLPLRSKSFSSWDELRSKYDSGEFTDDDVSYINPEESGIQDFEQYEIKPDDIIDLEQINLEEGRKKKPDPKKGTGKKPEGSGRRLYTDEDPKDTVRIKFKTKEDIVDTLNKTSFKAKSHSRQSQVINLIHQRVRAAYGKAKDPEVKSRLKRALDYIEGRKEASKEKTKRLNKLKEEKELNEGRYDSISRQLAKLTLNYWKEGFAKGKNEVNYIDRITPDEYPTDLEFLYNGGVIFTPSGGKYSHNGYAMSKGETKDGTPRVGVNYFVPKDMIPQGWEEIYMDLITTLRHEIEHLTQAGGNVKQGKEMDSDMKLRKLIDTNKDVVRYVLLPKEVDANVQGLYLKAKKWRRPYAEVVDEWINDFLKIKKQSDIDLIKGVYNKRAKELNLPSILEENPKNDPFGLNELAKTFIKEVFHETWNPQEDFLSLCVFMRDNGMNITPLPKIKVIKDDEENASRLLGKTAYYNPADKSITLYTLGRHPKDVLRSFAHEMVHHEQNLNGTLGNITTTNTNEDDHLQELEKEAYLKGNIMLRKWEDSIKNV